MLEIRRATTGLAAALAAIVAWGLVTVAPPDSADRVEPRSGQFKTQVVRLAAVTATELRTAAITATAAVSPVAPTGAPVAATAISPSANQMVPLAATATDVASTVQNIAGVGVGLLIAPVWYSLAPITFSATFLAAAALFTVIGLLLCTGSSSCGGGFNFDALLEPVGNFFLTAPFLAGRIVVAWASNTVGSWLHALFPGIAAQAAAATGAAAAATATSVLNKRVGRLSTAVNTAQTPASATPVPQTVPRKLTLLPKPVSSAVDGSVPAGPPSTARNEPSVLTASHGTRVTSKTSTLSDTLKHLDSTTGVKPAPQTAARHQHPIGSAR